MEEDKLEKPEVDDTTSLKSNDDTTSRKSGSTSPSEKSSADTADKKPKRRSLPVIDQPWTRIFPKNEVISLETYLKLKREERQAIIQHHAATIIQSAWTGFLIRFNLRIIVEALTKIQSGLRGHIARERCHLLREERIAKNLADKRRRAATKIQSTWRGYRSRKVKLDYASWKKIQLKNEALKRSIERINELEALLLQQSQEEDSRKSVSTQRSSQRSRKSSFDPCREKSIQFDNLTPSLETLIIDKLPELVNEMSEARISELYAYLANLETEMKTERALERMVEKLGGIENLDEEQRFTLEQSQKKQRERANLILDLAKLGMIGTLKEKFLPREKDSVDEMFPPIPSREDLVQPDPGKVESLKRAIRMFRERKRLMEDAELKKKHVLLRTSQVPGVFSDIYTKELTEIEKRIKSVKYWKGSLIAERVRQKEEAGVAAKNQRLRRLFTHALRISGKDSTPSNNGTADDEQELEELGVTTRTAAEGDSGTEGDGEMMDLGNDDNKSDAESRGSGMKEYQPSPVPPPPTPV